MLFVILLLNTAAAVGLDDSALHRIGHAVGVHDDHTVGVSCGTSDCLDQGAFRSEEALLIRVENCDQADLGDIQTLSQQVDTHQHVELAQSQVAHDLHTLDGIDIVVHITHLDIHALEVLGEILRHLLGEGRDQNALALLGADIDLGDQVVKLTLGRSDGDLGIEQSRGTDDLLRHDGALLQLQIAGRRADEHRLIQPLIELVEVQRAVIIGGRQSEAVVDQALFARVIAAVHTAHLRQCHVAFIHEQQKVLREVVE